MTFTINQTDIDVLLKAVEALDRQPLAEAIVEGFLRITLARDEDSARSARSEMKHAVERVAVTSRIQRDQSVMLRAKLIALRAELDQSDAERILAEAQR